MKINYTLNVLFTFFTLTCIRSNNCKYKSGKQESCFGRIYWNYMWLLPRRPRNSSIILQNNNPGNVFLINIHQGGYANPGNSGFDFRTPFGNAIAAQVGANFYPSGTINRNSNALGRRSIGLLLQTLLLVNLLT